MAKRKPAFKNVSACNRHVRSMLDKAAARQKKYRAHRKRMGPKHERYE
jgi:hypothetical protein